MTKNDVWATASETVKRLAEMGICGENGEPYKPGTLRYWKRTNPDFPAVRVLSSNQSLYNCPKVAKWKLARGDGRTGLDDEKVRDIRTRFTDGARLIDLAADYGVGTSTIWSIVTRKNWAHVQ